MKKAALVTFLISLLLAGSLKGQDLDQLLASVPDSIPDFAYGTFKGTTIINGQSVEVPGRTDFQFIISHRFGAVNTGLYNFFGLDQGTTRLGLEYGIKDILSLSLGRSTYDKTFDGSVKVRILRQQTGKRNIPVSISLFSGVYVETVKWTFPDRDNLFSSRLSYSNQLLIARKFNKNLSLQITPSFVHFNLVEKTTDQNDVFAVGAGGRYKITKKFSANAEYFWLLPGATADNYANSLSLGFDLETGGHVFQIHFTNSQYMFAPGFIARNEGEWRDGDIYIGFNIYRVFPTGKKGRNIK